jgi:hypothetical protein
MAQIVNLRRRRKRTRRIDGEEKAAANRLLHGRTAAEKAKTALLKELQEKRVDGHRRDGGDGKS